jgi:hypothetical protein
MKLPAPLFWVTVVALLATFVIEAHYLGREIMPMRGGSIGGALGLFVGFMFTIALVDLRGTD